VEGLKKHSNEATCKAERQKVYETALTALWLVEMTGKWLYFSLWRLVAWRTSLGQQWNAANHLQVVDKPFIALCFMSLNQHCVI
jgi:hypothetical protein